MDELVVQAMAKWPHVPDCSGWLGLDARGQWFMRNEATQRAGSFQSGDPQAKGSRVDHDKLKAFIERNYTSDAQGRWFFQNGPQRVFVELEHTPWIWRVDDDGSVHSHTGQPSSVRSVWQDEHGRAYLHTDLGFGLVHTQDVGHLVEVLEREGWPLHDILAREMPQRFGYVQSPQAMQA